MMTAPDFVHESFWVAAATAAPVIGLAHSVLIGRNLERIDKWRNELAVTVDCWTKASEVINANEERLEAEQAETSKLRNRIEESSVRASSSDEEDFNAPVRELASAILDFQSASSSNYHQMDLVLANIAVEQVKKSGLPDEVGGTLGSSCQLDVRYQSWRNGCCAWRLDVGAGSTV